MLPHRPCVHGSLRAEPLVGLHTSRLTSVAAGGDGKVDYEPMVDAARYADTALYVGEMNGCGKVMEVLLAHGGTDVNAVDLHGWTALQGAAENGHGDVVKQLLAVGDTVDGA